MAFSNAELLVWREVSETAYRRLVMASEEVMLKQNLSQLEEMVTEEANKLARVLLKLRLQVDPRANANQAFICPHCQGKLRIQEGGQVRILPSVFGDVEYRRPYGTCDRCHVSFAPMDCELGIPPSGGSVKRTKQVCHAAVTARSFESAADILREHDNIELSTKQVRIVAENEGEKLVAQSKREVEAFKQGKRTFTQTAAPDLVVVTADGGRVQTRQAENGSIWKEDKVGGVYDASPRKDPSAVVAEEYEGAKAKIKTYVASMVAWEEFGWMLCVEAMRRGYPHAKDKLFISDGAEALKSLRQMHFNDAVFILDWYHAAEHLSDCAKAAFGMGSDECQRWYERMKRNLWEGKVDRILHAIKKESLRLGKPASGEWDNKPQVVLHRNLGYFANNREGLNYPRFRAEGWPIGSGIAEGAVKQFGIRLKGSEKFWNGFGFGRGANEMLALCALHLSEDHRWETYWNRRAQPYIRQRKREAA